MKIVKKVITRLNMAILLIVIQIALIVSLFDIIVNNFQVIAIVSYSISVFVVLILVKKYEAFAYSRLWLVVIMVLPISGGILYLLFGNDLFIKKMKGRLDREHGLIARQLNNTGNLPDIKMHGDRISGLAQYIKRISSYPAYENTETKYYPLGELMLEDMLVELAKAEEFIFMEYFIIAEGKMWDVIFEILARKAEQGVDVRLIFDGVGSLKLSTASHISKFESKRIKIVQFNPVVPFFSLFMNHRDHRKMLIIDGHIGFVGGINIADEYINQYEYNSFKFKDTGVKMEGEGVWSFSLMFICIWNAFCKPEERIENFTKSTGQYANDGLVIPYGDSPLDSERLGENIYIDVLNQSKRYVYIFTPFLIISEKMTYALQMAAKRGVDVRIVTPGIMDWKFRSIPLCLKSLHRQISPLAQMLSRKALQTVSRSFYRDLQKAGVRIYEYSPGFLHAKSFVCDDEIAVVGTINLDYRSLYLHFECATVLYKSSTILNIREDAIETIAKSREFHLKSHKRNFFVELFDSILHLFSPFL